jgi:hypothetical protein
MVFVENRFEVRLNSGKTGPNRFSDSLQEAGTCPALRFARWYMIAIE